VTLLLAVGSALWLGLLTAVSPCPLATNIAALSFISRRVERPGRVALSGLFYAAGRSLAYIGVGAAVVWGLLSVPKLSAILQGMVNELLGPVLIVVGMVLLEMVPLPVGKGSNAEGAARRLETLGLWGMVPLGILFALSFCPVSAAFFFGGLVSLSVANESVVLLPAVFGAGTALPVIVFAILIAWGVKGVGTAFNVLSKIEWWARRITGWAVVAAGVVLVLRYVFELV